MTKKELESILKAALRELNPTINQAEQAAIQYAAEQEGDGRDKLAFEVGFLRGRIKNVISILNEIETK